MSGEEAAFAVLGDWQNFATYRGALVIPVDPAGRVLLQLRDHHPDAANPGQWGLFGGEVEPGETLCEAAVRELEEETGLKIPADRLHPLARTVSAISRKRLYAFTAALTITPADIRLGEGAGFGFIEARDFAAMNIVPSVRMFLDEWLGQSKRG
jgi:8-oxo-dGTP pyrophosphatase MutT (NUDIX family)